MAQATADPGRGDRAVTVGAAFLMATSAIGPGFLTQTAVFTGELGADFAFAILVSIVLALAVQLNVWRALVASGLRAPELASRLVPGLGGALCLLVVLGGLVFNVGNVAGCGLGLAVFGIPAPVGAGASGAAVVGLLLSPRAGRTMDAVTRGLGFLMIFLTAGVLAASHPDLLSAARASVWPSRHDALPILTLVGGTVGGYIPFSGAHRLLDAGLRGKDAVPRATRSGVLGIGVTAAMRALFFLAVLGVVSRGGALDPANPPASAFRLGAGEWGYLFFGAVLWSAAVTSTVGCTYTSISFLESVLTGARRRRALVLVAFVAASLGLFLGVGRPVRLLILAGALNGLILPATLLVALWAARRPDLVSGYEQPRVLTVAGWVAWAAAALAAWLSLGEIGRLWS
jgi:Mn2+/Fe2+ NRAMP family transporter